MLNFTEDILNQTLKEFAETAKIIQQPVQDAQKIIDVYTELIKNFEREIAKHQEIFDQLSSMVRTVDIPNIITNDILEIWKNDNTLINDERRGLAEDFGYAIIESAETLIEEHQPDDTNTVQLRLTSDGKLFLVEDPKKSHDLSPEMEQLIRGLNKNFTSTDILLANCGYTTKRSISSAINKLNAWGRGKFELCTPIVIGQQGKGYRLSKHIHIHKIPRKKLDK